MKKDHELLERVRWILEEATDVLGQSPQRARAKDMPGGSRPQERDELGMGQLDLFFKKREASIHLGPGRRPIFGRPALDDVGGKDALLRIDPGLKEHGVQKLSRPSDKSAPDPVLLGARSFSEEKQLGRQAPAIDDQMSPAIAEAAKPAIEGCKLGSKVLIALRGEDGGLSRAHFDYAFRSPTRLSWNVEPPPRSVKRALVSALIPRRFLP